MYVSTESCSFHLLYSWMRHQLNTLSFVTFRFLFLFVFVAVGVMTPSGCTPNTRNHIVHIQHAIFYYTRCAKCKIYISCSFILNPYDYYYLQIFSVFRFECEVKWSHLVWIYLLIEVDFLSFGGNALQRPIKMYVQNKIADYHPNGRWTFQCVSHGGNITLDG